MTVTEVGRSLTTALLFLVLAASSVVVPSDAMAQTTVGNIRGYVRSQGGEAVGDAQVSARNLQTNRSRGTISQASGFYYLGGLEPGQYELTVRRVGMAQQTLPVRLLIGQTLDLNFQLGEAPVTLAGVETIAEQGVETRTSEVATNLDERQVEQLPVADRNFLALSALAPGVTIQGERLDDTRKTFSVGAQGAEQVNLFIDGATYKNDLIKGGVAGQDASRGNPFPMNAVQEFRILTQNYKAEYQKASSGIITARTKSGGTEWEGTAFYTFLNKDLVALNDFQRRDRAGNPNFTRPNYERQQFGFSAGGPIVNRLRFFGSYERNNQDRTRRVEIVPPFPAGQFPALDTVNFLARNGEFQVPFHSDLGFAKLSFDHTPTSTFELSYNHRREDDERDFGALQAREVGNKFHNTVNTGILKHTLSRGMWLNEATVSFQRYRFDPEPLEPGPVNRFYGFGCCAEIGSNLSNQDFTQKRLSVRNDVTYSGFQAWGEHVFKFGANVDFLNYDVIKRNSETPRFVYEPWFPHDSIGFSIPHRVEFQTGDPNFSDNNSQLGAYIQDDWSPTKQLTLNLGVRWDYESGMMNYDYETPSAVRDSISKYRDSLFIPLDEDRYFTDGNDRDRYLTAFQPRVGFSYAIDRDGRTTLFGGWGLFIDRTLYDQALEEQFALQHPAYTIFFAPPGTTPGPGQVAWDERYLREGKTALDQLVATRQANTPEAKLLPNDLRPPKSQQFSAGIRQLVGNFALEAAYTGVRSKNVFTFYWANMNFVCPERSFSVPDCFRNRRVPGFSVILFAHDAGKTWYDALQLKVDRRFQPGNIIGWGGGLAYTLAKRQTEGFNDDFSFPNPVDYPKQVRNDERHRVVLHWLTESRYAWGIQFSGLITLGSGVPFDVGDRFANNFQPGAGRPEKRSFIIPNAWAYRVVDLRLRKDFVNFRGSSMGVTADLFNAFNYNNFGCFGNQIDAQPTCVISDPRRFQIGVQFDYARRVSTQGR
ncbi:MAG TPA: TonB-dependent receptor [Gemmatimonadaceae bacterium]|nr:TonB-dependent receptor [Gemmatimonadaceae bacterium]